MTTIQKQVQEQREWDAFSASMTVEGACGYETDDPETYYSALQYLIDTGICWTLQGFFGRTAAAAIDSGLCHRAGEESLYK